MSRCKACGAACRKSTVAMVAGDDGWSVGRVCRACKRRGLLVVGLVTRAATPARVVKADAVRRALSQLGGMRAGLVRTLSDEPGRVDAKIEGLDMAMHALERFAGDGA